MGNVNRTIQLILMACNHSINIEGKKEETAKVPSNERGESAFYTTRTLYNRLGKALEKV